MKVKTTKKTRRFENDNFTGYVMKIASQFQDKRLLYTVRATDKRTGADHEAKITKLPFRNTYLPYKVYINDYDQCYSRSLKSAIDYIIDKYYTN